MLPADGSYADFQFWTGNSNTQSTIRSADKTMLHLLPS
jgi:hypothetical protein